MPPKASHPKANPLIKNSVKEKEKQFNYILSIPTFYSWMRNDLLDISENKKIIGNGGDWVTVMVKKMERKYLSKEGQ
jgi:hypothetical protein